MIYSSVNQKYQATIPQEIRNIMHLQQGDKVGFEVINGQIIIKKITPLNIEFAKAVEATLTEWSSEEDDKAYHDL